MATLLDDKELASLQNEAAATAEIAKALGGLTIDQRERLANRVHDLWPMIREATQSEADAAERHSEQLALVETEVAALEVARPALQRFLGTLFGILPVALILGGIGGSIVLGGFGKLLTFLLDLRVLALLAGLLVALWLCWRYYRRTGARLEVETAKLRSDRADQRGMAALRDRHKENLASVHRVALDAAVRAWRRAFDEFQRPSYSVKFAPGATPGLATAFSPHLVVETPARLRLLSLLGQLSGSSIGVAGTRGAGKSTLIQSICGPQVRTIGERKAMSVMVSAPVDYQARDFLLHLFASACHRVIELRDPKYRRHEVRQHLLPVGSQHLDLLRLLLTIGLVAGLLSMFLLLASLALAVESDVRPASPGIAPTTAASAAATASAASVALNAASAASAPVPAGSGVAASAAAAIAASAPRTASTPLSNAAASAAAPASAAASAAITRTGFEKLLTTMGVSAAGLAATSLALAAISVVLVLSVHLRVLEVRRQRPMPQPDPAAQSTAPPPPRSSPWVAPWRAVSDWYAHLAPLSASADTDPLVAQARHWLQEIKFQQSWTVGWSGALKMPFGLEGGASQARQMAQQQMSVPEIVDSFGKFLGDVARQYLVLIGIDELDKIESDEKAQRFLNDIKVVFGTDGVFFLVSVSEDAMSQFERRGLPFRDAFDSAFDEVINVQPLNFASARLMLGERVIGLPMPFQALCWVLSGGLARELVRTSRDLAETLRTRPAGTPVPIGVVAQALVKAEVQGKADAVSHAAERLAQSRLAVALLRQVDELLLLDPLDAQSLVDAHAALRALAEPPLPQPAGGEPDLATNSVRDLARELSAFVLYLAAVMSFFAGTPPDQARLDDALGSASGDDGWLSLLPRALRQMAIHPELARDRVLLFLSRSGAKLQGVP